MRKRVLITGASGGIGIELARTFAKNDYDLILVARNNEILSKLKNELVNLYHVDVRIVCIDLSLPENSKKLFDAIGYIRVDILINNAGVGNFGEFYKSDLDKEENLIMLNILALVKLTHLYVQQMIKRDSGIIFNIASTASFQPGPLMANYYASKAYVLSFTEAIAEEMKNTNVKVIAYCPGPTNTKFLERANVRAVKKHNNFSIYSPKKIADDIFKTIDKKCVVRIPSKRMRIAIFLQRFIPRKIVTKFVHTVQSKRKV